MMMARIDVRGGDPGHKPIVFASAWAFGTTAAPWITAQVLW